MCRTCHAADNMECLFLVIYLQRYVKNDAWKNNISYFYNITNHNEKNNQCHTEYAEHMHKYLVYIQL